MRPEASKVNATGVLGYPLAGAAKTSVAIQNVVDLYDLAAGVAPLLTTERRRVGLDVPRQRGPRRRRLRRRRARALGQPGTADVVPAWQPYRVPRSGTRPRCVCPSLPDGARRRSRAPSEAGEREAPILLSCLGEVGLVPGATLEVQEVDRLARTLQVRVGDRSVTLSDDTGSKAWVVTSGWSRAGRRRAHASRALRTGQAVCR
jgi:hypothetical protein